MRKRPTPGLRKRQMPGQRWVFVNRKTKETHVVVLPSEYGESNGQVRWRKSPWGGSWESRLLSKPGKLLRIRGEGQSGLLSRMSYILIWARQAAKKGKYKPPFISPEELLKLWESQNSKCAACLGSFKDIFASRLDHNHETGEARGFIHDHCNIVEGRTLKMSDEEFKNLVNFIDKIREKKNQGAYYGNE